MGVEQIMFLLIRSEICDQDIDENIIKKLNPEMLKELYALSLKHDLVHIVASALSKAGALKEDETSEHFRASLMVALYRDSQKEYAISQIEDVLEKSQISYIMLKGSIIRKHYPQSWMRTSCDVDVLIHKNDCEEAISKLCKEGFVRISDSSTHDYNLISPGGVHLELHFTLTQENGYIALNEKLKSVWENITTDVNYKYKCRMLNEWFMLYHIAHMSRHFLNGGCGIRPFIDLWLLKKKISYDDEKLNALLQETKLLKFFSQASVLSEVWLESAPHNVLTAQMENYILTGGVYGTSFNVATVKASNGKGKCKSFVEMMFLPRVNLEVLYPRLKKHPTLLPFYQVKRWFKIIDKNKRKELQQLIKIHNSISQKDICSVTDLLEGLELKS